VRSVIKRCHAFIGYEGAAPWSRFDVKLAIEALDVRYSFSGYCMDCAMSTIIKTRRSYRVVLYQCGVVHQQAIIALNECPLERDR